MTPNFLHKLLPSPEAKALFSSETLIKNMITVECAYLQIMGGDATAYAAFTPNSDAVENAMARDGVAVPELVTQMRAFHDDPLLHKGMTSQDVMDTALMLSISAMNAQFLEEIRRSILALDALIETFGLNTMMARTRMQAALPIPAATRLKNWQNGFCALQDDLTDLRPKLECVSLGGPVGDGRDWTSPQNSAARLAEILALSPQPFVWHSLRGRIQDYGNWLAKLTGHCGKLGQDIALMAQQGIDEIKLTGGGSSSAMAHKSNPIQAELLVSLARHNAGQLGTLAQAMIHEQERSGAAWTLEWLTLSPMIENAEAALHLSASLFQQIEWIGHNKAITES